jgi:hypothetical protein
MNAQLIEAIRQLNLKPGESYTVEVDGRRLVIHDEAAEPSVYEGQVMMMPWFDSPRGPVEGTIHLRPGKLPPPDPVIVPDDEENPS